MRERRRGLVVNHSVERQLGRVYRLLIAQFNLSKVNCIGGRSDEDIFSDTMMFVLSDKGAVNLTDEEFISHFKRRYKMIKFQIYKDQNMKREESIGEVE